MQKITPFLWFEKNISEVLEYYCSIFPGSHTDFTGVLENTPSGHIDTATLVIYDVNFRLMTAGPYLPFNPTVSFIVSCDSIEELEAVWGRILPNGKILMNLAVYPFAEQFGWIQDAYGISWQLMYSSTMKAPQKVTPTMMFTGAQCGRAKEALDFYTSVFRNSSIDYVMNYEDDGDGEEITSNGVIKHAGFTIENFHMAMMDANRVSPLTFRQAISFMVECDNQAEVDYYWEKLTEDGEESQCGWLNDKFGFPWQIVPSALNRMMSTGTPEQVARVVSAFMQMKKYDISTLELAFGEK